MILGLLGCKQNPSEGKTENINNPKVIDFDNKLAFNDFSKLNLDDKCVNLLDPKNTSEAERESVINSWSNFHKKVSKFLQEEKFDWA